jgi:hypothetical protein
LWISPATAELALEALRVVLRVSQHQRNGSPLPEVWRTAIDELTAVRQADEFIHIVGPDTAGAVDGTEVGTPVSSVPELIDVAEAARRLGIKPRATRKRLAVGSLPGRKVGQTWLVEWTGEPRLGQMRGGDGDGSSVSSQGAGGAAVGSLLDA